MFTCIYICALLACLRACLLVPPQRRLIRASFAKLMGSSFTGSSEEDVEEDSEEDSVSCFASVGSGCSAGICSGCSASFGSGWSASVGSGCSAGICSGCSASFGSGWSASVGSGCSASSGESDPVRSTISVAGCSLALFFPGHFFDSAADNVLAVASGIGLALGGTMDSSLRWAGGGYLGGAGASCIGGFKWPCMAPTLGLYHTTSLSQCCVDAKLPLDLSIYTHIYIYTNMYTYAYISKQPTKQNKQAKQTNKTNEQTHQINKQTNKPNKQKHWDFVFDHL